MAVLKVISNSSPLINLSKIQRLDLLSQLYGEVIIPQAVYDEIVQEGTGRPGSSNIQVLCAENKIIVEKVKNKNLITALRKDLDKGEAEVIALALEIDHHLILLDETDARKMASFYNLQVTGFIGVLLKAFRLGLINDFKSDLDKAIKLGFYINPMLYRQLLDQLK